MVEAMSEPVAVRLGKAGPVHLAFPISDARLVSVCGGQFGHASVVPAARWLARRARRCDECAEAAAATSSTRVLRIIAGL